MAFIITDTTFVSGAQIYALPRLEQKWVILGALTIKGSTRRGSRHQRNAAVNIGCSGIDLGVCSLALGGLLFLRLSSIGPRLAAFGGLGFLSIGCNGDGAGHLFGGDGVLARLVGLKCGNHAVDGGFDGLHLVALRCAHRELQLFIRGSLHGLVARAVGDAVIGKRRFCGKIQLDVYLLVRRSRLCAGGIRLGARSRCGAGGVAFSLVARIAGLVAFRRIRGFCFGRGRFRRLVCGNVFDLGRDPLFGCLFGLFERRECRRAHHLGGQQRRKEDCHGLHAVLPPASEDSAALHSHHSPSACDCSLASTFCRARRRCLPLRLRGLWRQPRQAGAWRFPASITKIDNKIGSVYHTSGQERPTQERMRRISKRMRTVLGCIYVCCVLEPERMQAFEA